MTNPTSSLPLHQHLASAKVYDLAHRLEASTPVSPSAPPFRHALLFRHGDHPSGAPPRQDEMTGAGDLFSLGGHTGTHIDALCHVGLRGRMHGDVDAYAAQSTGRMSVHGVETIAPIFCRGVLLDVPRAHGLEGWPAGEPITAEHLEHTSRVARVEVLRGDAVLVRTGWPVGRFSDAPAYIGHGTGVPGPDISAARWLADHGIRLSGADTLAYEWIPAGQGHTNMAVHVHLLVHHGIHLVEVMDLEGLAADGVSVFSFVLTPLKLVGATGSPCRPVALVAD